MSVILDGLNEAQLRAVTHENGPLLIVAGAGTGKTTVLAKRYAWLLQEKGLKADQILALTFTEKAAQEMEDRVLQLLPNGSYDFWISTFHGFCQRILESQALEIGLPHRFRLVTETDAWLLLKRHIDELPLDHYRPLGNPVKFLGGLLQHISRAKDEGVSAERYLEFADQLILEGDEDFIASERKRLKELASCYVAYRDLLRQEDALDFGDLILETLRLLRERPAVLKQWQAQFKVIMVDEFQDTNWAQYELVKLLAGQERNLTVVGDDDQAIYKFRGASLANILQFRDDYPDSKTVALTENYRSKQEILDIAYRFIRTNDPNRLEVSLADTGLQKKLVAAKGNGGVVQTKWYHRLEEEAEGIVRMIKHIKNQDETLRWDDIAILVRSNDGALPFVRSLELHHVPFQFFALRGLYAKPLILDIQAIFGLCTHPYDSPLLWRVLLMDVYAIPARDAAELIQYANRKGIPLWQALQASSKIPNLHQESLVKIERLLTDIENIAEASKRETPLRLLQIVLDKTGIPGRVLKLPEGERMEAIRLLNSFADRIKRYELMTHGPSLKGFMEELRLEIESGEQGALDADAEAGPELVKVMTIHASKGLEFRHVFIVSLVDQRFPTRERSEAIPLPSGLINERLSSGDSHVEEERRLFYVAMTRAKETLTLSGASWYGGARQRKPSVFFQEAGLEIAPASADHEATLSLKIPDILDERELAEREVFPLKRRFSFTQLAAFRNCPLQYKFAHIYRVPVLGSFHKSFGQSIHLTLHDILQLHCDRTAAHQTSLFDILPVDVPTKSGFTVTLEEALAIYDERWIDEWYPDRKRHDEYQEEGRRVIQRMWASWNTLPPSIVALESPFNWKLGEHSLKGSVDRIDMLPDGSVAIYDYKTGESKESDDLETSDKEQLRIYQLAMEERGMKVGKLAYVYVRSGAEAIVEPLVGDKRLAFTEDIQERMQQILASRFLPQPSPFICKHCDFRSICEFRKL